MTNNCEAIPVQTPSKKKSPPKDKSPPPTTVETTQTVERLFAQAKQVCDNPAPTLTTCYVNHAAVSATEETCSATVVPPAMSSIKSVVVPSKCPAITLATEKEAEVFKVFAQMLQLYKADQIMFSFNGGKDCTVALHMLHKFYQSNALRHLQLPVLYIQSEDAFPQIDVFVEDCAKRYNLLLIKRQGGIKQILQQVLEEMPQIKAVVMGNRSTDPYCDKLKIMQVTDPDWPPLMRVNPILHWTYSDVWTYIFVFRVPYCSLYDCGFTSIGGMKNTQRNPSLRRIDKATGETKYLPAYELQDGSLERAGRILTNSVDDA